MTVSDEEIDTEKTNSLLRKLKAGHFGNLFISGMFNGIYFHENFKPANNLYCNFRGRQIPG